MEKYENRQTFSEIGGGQLHIALCLTDNLAHYIEPVVYSLSNYHPNQQLIVHLVFQHLTSVNLSRLYQLERLLYNVRMDFCQVEPSQFSHIEVGQNLLPVESYFRFLLPELLPNVERIFYLDVDTLVCGNLWEAYQTDLGPACIAAVVERDVQIFFPDHPSTLGVAPDRYFNSGVLLLDLASMRARGLSQVLINLAVKHHQSLRFGDQDVLNLYFKDEVVFLPAGYNYTNYMMRYVLAPWEDLRILHFNGPVKPWFKEFELDPDYVDHYMNYIAKYKEHQLEYLELLLRK